MRSRAENKRIRVEQESEIKQLQAKLQYYFFSKLVVSFCSAKFRQAQTALEQRQSNPSVPTPASGAVRVSTNDPLVPTITLPLTDFDRMYKREHAKNKKEVLRNRYS